MFTTETMNKYLKACNFCRWKKKRERDRDTWRNRSKRIFKNPCQSPDAWLRGRHCVKRSIPGLAKHQPLDKTDTSIHPSPARAHLLSSVCSPVVSELAGQTDRLNHPRETPPRHHPFCFMCFCSTPASLLSFKPFFKSSASPFSLSTSPSSSCPPLQPYCTPISAWPSSDWTYWSNVNQKTGK